MCIYIYIYIYTHMLSSVDKQNRTVLVLLTSGRLHMAGKKPVAVAKSPANPADPSHPQTEKST